MGVHEEPDCGHWRSVERGGNKNYRPLTQVNVEFQKEQKSSCNDSFQNP